MNFCAAAMISSERASHSSLVSPQAVMPWPPRITPIASGCSRLDRGDVEAELEARAPPGHPGDPAAEALAGQRLAVRRGRERDAGVGVQVVDVRRLDEAVHRGVDRRGGAALAERAEVERGDHLVLALDPRVDVAQGAQRVEPQHREARRGERAEVAARALHPQQLGRLPGDRVGRRALGGGVAAGVVRVLRVCPAGWTAPAARRPPRRPVSVVQSGPSPGRVMAVRLPSRRRSRRRARRRSSPRSRRPGTP